MEHLCALSRTCDKGQERPDKENKSRAETMEKREWNCTNAELSWPVCRHNLGSNLYRTDFEHYRRCGLQQHWARACRFIYDISGSVAEMTF